MHTDSFSIMRAPGLKATFIFLFLVRAGRSPFTLLAPPYISHRDMPSRRRTRRATRSQRRTRRLMPIRHYPSPQKPRLVRRFVRNKLDDTAAKINSKSKHVGTSNSTLNKNLALKAPTSHDSHNSAAKTTTTFYGVAGEITAVPNPTPDVGPNTTNSAGAGFPLFGAISSGTQTNTTLAPTIVKQPPPVTRTPSKISFSALPPLLSLVRSSTVTTLEYTNAFLPSPTVQTAPTVEDQRPNLRTRQITVIVIVLLSVGSGLLLLGTCIIVKICMRRRCHQRPVPSLPVLKDIESDEDFFDTGDSPLFGGDSRMSATTGYNGPTWNWVQYPHTAVSQPQPSQPTPPKTASVSQDSLYATRHPRPVQNPSTAGPAESSAAPSSLPDAAIAAVPKRLSAASSVHYKVSKHHDISNAHGRQETTFTADGHDLINRSKPKTNNRRSRQLEVKAQRDSTNSLVGLAYDSEDIISPVAVEYVQTQDIPFANNSEGRERVRSGYFAAGTYPRISTLPSASYSIATATRVNVAQRNSFSKDKFALQRSNSKRLRDTQALTYALGLASPADYGYGTVSPQPTLYPDDSVSIFEAKKPKKRNITGDKMTTEPVPDIPVIVPSQVAGNMGIDDSLMGMSFGVSQMSLSALSLDPTSQATEARKMDRPPRVPSPPPMPSLAQMALAHSNPEAYANYRSPTYSLYGLYEGGPDRKSIVR